MIIPKENIMELAIKEAKLARREGDYAVGAVLARGDKNSNAKIQSIPNQIRNLNVKSCFGF